MKSMDSVQDGTAMLWDLQDGKKLYSLEANEIIHSLCFSPNRYWLCAATQDSIKARGQPCCRGIGMHHDMLSTHSACEARQDEDLYSCPPLNIRLH